MMFSLTMKYLRNPGWFASTAAKYETTTAKNRNNERSVRLSGCAGSLRAITESASAGSPNSASATGPLTIVPSARSSATAGYSEVSRVAYISRAPDTQQTSSASVMQMPDIMYSDTVVAQSPTASIAASRDDVLRTDQYRIARSASQETSDGRRTANSLTPSALHESADAWNANGGFPANGW